MYVCLCKAVTDHQIRDAVREGVRSYAALCRELELARQCGRCGLEARRVFRDALEPGGRTDTADELFYPAATPLASA